MLKLTKKSVTLGVLAASLVLSQGVYAKNDNNNGKNEASQESTQSSQDDQTESDTDEDEDTEADTDEDTDADAEEETEDEAEVDAEAEATVDVEKFFSKLEKIQAKFEQSTNEDAPAEAQQGKLGAVQNRVDALKAQLEELAPLQEELDDLEGEEKETAVRTLRDLYAELGEFEEALKVQSDYVKTLSDAPDQEVLSEYKELGKLLKQMGKIGVKALVNGEEPEMDVEPLIEEGRTLVPFRALAEKLGAEVAYDAATKTVTVTKDDVEVKLTINSMVAYVNDKEYVLDVPAKIKDGRTIIPLRFLSEGLKARVLWEQETQTAIVISDDAEAEAETETETDVDAEGEETVTDATYNE